MAVGCCGLAAIVGMAVPAAIWSVLPEGMRWAWADSDEDVLMTERMEETFEVGSAPELEVNQLAGSVVIRAGEEGTIRVVATKQARGREALDAITIRWIGQDSRVEVRTSFPALGNSTDTWVPLEITVPRDTKIDVSVGAGGVHVIGVQGALRIEEGAGGIQVSGASGPVRLSAGSGGIRYEGRPEGECRFLSAAGGIGLLIQRDADVTVDLGATLGDVQSKFPVRGTVQRRVVRGTVGSGGPARITARAGIGGVDLLRQ
jgi:hypothetical protein